MERKYLVVIEGKAGSNFSAYVPDLPGCVATGETFDEVKRLIGEAIDLHIQGMIEDGQEVPEPTCQGDYVTAVTAA